jgi:hypothetical protein
MDGAPIWQREIKGIKSLWAAGSFLYLANADNELVCIHSNDGSIQWIKQLPKFKNEKSEKGKVIVAGPVLAGEKLIVVTSNGNLLFISPYDGSVIEERKVSSGINLLPVVVGNQIYLLSNNGILEIL